MQIKIIGIASKLPKAKIEIKRHRRRQQGTLQVMYVLDLEAVDQWIKLRQ
jgi:hypothetical protein